MWRLIELLIILLAELVFILFNQNARSDISIGFRVFYNAPVYIITIIAFLAGAAAALPFFIASHFKHRRKEKKEKYERKKGEVEIPAEPRAGLDETE